MAYFQAEIIIDLEDEGMAEAISKALEPDNKTAPKGLKVKSENHKTLLRIEAGIQERPETLQATLDDLILCLQAAYNTLKRIKINESQE